MPPSCNRMRYPHKRGRGLSTIAAAWNHTDHAAPAAWTKTQALEQRGCLKNNVVERAGAARRSRPHKSSKMLSLTNQTLPNTMTHGVGEQPVRVH